MLENNLSKALILARSEGFSIFLVRPISATLLVLATVVLVYPLIQPHVRRVRTQGEPA
jgi:TctA family transporter